MPDWSTNKRATVQQRSGKGATKHTKRTKGKPESDCTAQKRAAEEPRQRPEKRRKKQVQSNGIEPPQSIVHPEPSTRKANAILHWAQYDSWPSGLAQPIALLENNRSCRTRGSTYKSTTLAGTMTEAYNNSKCVRFLNSCGAFLFNHSARPLPDEKLLCRRLFDERFETPKDSAFDERTFEYVCTRLVARNEIGVMQTIHRLTVPSAETASHSGEIEFEHLVDSINEPWDGSNALNPPAANPPGRGLQYRLPKPQPDYAVGFKVDAFTREQMRKLQPHLGTGNDTSFFKGTLEMLFPFFAVEIKAFIGSMEAAGRANRHSTVIGMRGVYELFRSVKREQELHRKILAFSISHNHEVVHIHAHCPVITGDQASYYRHGLDCFNFTMEDGEKRWRAYNFVMAIYNTWVPVHFKFLASAVDNLPEIDFDVSSPPESRQQETPRSGSTTESSAGGSTSPDTSPESGFSSCSPESAPRPTRRRKQNTPRKRRKR
ncbi:uncharacterized protein BJX67DRAFT_381156 [Aspergillus lucknowensis]|uniref:DUF7924 domain-containing protein n=1 Tax=Aspergillus lucknowensis TaxID=176173 RepID=A0ABR4LSN5_9EURO